MPDKPKDTIYQAKDKPSSAFNLPSLDTPNNKDGDDSLKSSQILRVHYLPDEFTALAGHNFTRGAYFPHGGYMVITFPMRGPDAVCRGAVEMGLVIRSAD